MKRTPYVHNAFGIWRHFLLVQFNDFSVEFEDFDVFILEQFVRFNGHFLKTNEATIFAEYLGESKILMKSIINQFEDFGYSFRAVHTSFAFRDDVIEILDNCVNRKRSTFRILSTDRNFQFFQCQYNWIRHYYGENTIIMRNTAHLIHINNILLANLI